MMNQKGLSWVLFFLLALIWGSSFILIKKSAEQLTGWQIGAIRILSASIVFFPFAPFHIRKIPRAKLPVIFITGLLGNLFPAFLFALAIDQKVESSLAGILNSLTPLFVIGISVIFFRAKIEKGKIAGVLVGFGGLFLLSMLKGPVTLSNIGLMLLILLATIFYGLNVNVVGHYLKGLDPIKMATVSIGFLALPAGFILWLNPINTSNSAPLQQSIAAAIGVGLLGSAAATVIFYTLIKKAGGLFASLVTYVIPVIAMAWGFFDNETVGWLQVGCLGIILGGVYLANR